MSDENNKKEQAAKKALESKDAINRSALPESSEDVSNMEAVIADQGLGKLVWDHLLPRKLHLLMIY